LALRWTPFFCNVCCRSLLAQHFLSLWRLLLAKFILKTVASLRITFKPLLTGRIICCVWCTCGFLSTKSCVRTCSFAARLFSLRLSADSLRDISSVNCRFISLCLCCKTSLLGDAVCRTLLHRPLRLTTWKGLHL
jgi:hypothetical protein